MHLFGLRLPERLERGGPLRTVETEMNGDAKSTNKSGSSFLVRWACRYKRFLFCLGCPSRPCTKYFFPQQTLFQFLYPHRPASWAGNRAGSPVSYYCMCLCGYPLYISSSFELLCFHNSYCTFIIFRNNTIFLLFFHYFHFSCKLHRVAPFH